MHIEYIYKNELKYKKKMWNKIIIFCIKDEWNTVLGKTSLY